MFNALQYAVDQARSQRQFLERKGIFSWGQRHKFGVEHLLTLLSTSRNNSYQNGDNFFGRGAGQGAYLGAAAPRSAVDLLIKY